MKKLNAEWINYMKAYRIYDPKNSQQTVAYENNLETAKSNAIENGYDEIIECDSDIIHI